MKDDVSEYISDLLVDYFDVVERGELGPDTRFEEMEMDSLVLVELAVLLEKRFGTTTSDEELQEAGSVENAAELVDSRREDVADEVNH